MLGCAGPKTRGPGTMEEGTDIKRQPVGSDTLGLFSHLQIHSSPMWNTVCLSPRVPVPKSHTVSASTSKSKMSG